MLSAEPSRQLVFPIGIAASIFQFPRSKELRYIRYRGNGTPYKPVKIESLYDSFGLTFKSPRTHTVLCILLLTVVVFHTNACCTNMQGFKVFLLFFSYYSCIFVWKYSGGGTRTPDLQVMSLTSCQLLYPAAYFSKPHTALNVKQKLCLREGKTKFVQCASQSLKFWNYEDYLEPHNSVTSLIKSGLLLNIRTELAGSLQITDKQLLTSYLLLHF